MEEFLTDEESKVNAIEVESVENVKYLNDDKTLIVADVKFSYFKDVLPYAFTKNESERSEAVFDFINNNNIVIQDYVVDIEMEREIKHSEIKQKMQETRENLTVSYDSDMFDCNSNAQNNMNSLIASAQFGLTEFNIRSANEITHTFNAEQLKDLAILMNHAVDDVYKKYWNLKNEISLANTKSDLSKIQW